MLRRSIPVAKAYSLTSNVSQQYASTARKGHKKELALPGHGQGQSWWTKGTFSGGVPNIHYPWMRPGQLTRRNVEKRRNPYVDLQNGEYIYFRDQKDSSAAMAAERDAMGVRTPETSTDIYSEHKIVPDLYPDGFQWKHKLNSEYQQWRSNTWATPDLVPEEHQGRLLCNFWVNTMEFKMRNVKFSPKDHRQWTYCVLYVGTGKGIAGWGRSVAPSMMEAKRVATKEAFTNLIGVDLQYDGPKYPVRVNYEGCKVNLTPCPNLHAGQQTADIALAFGVWQCAIKVNATNGPARSGTTIAGGVFDAFKKWRSVNEVARARGKVPHSLVSNMFPYLEEMRRRKGMMAMNPTQTGKGEMEGNGVFAPNRTVDNRMPDHLKKGYYDDVYWKDFFAGDEKALNEPKMGLRGDELRQNLMNPVQHRYIQGKRVPSTFADPLARPGGGGGQRRTLQDVLLKLGKTPHDLGPIPVYDTLKDVKLTNHRSEHFHFHL